VEHLLDLLNLLDNDQLLTIFEKVVRAKNVVTWPEQPGDDERRARLQQISVQIVGVGFERRLANELQQRADGVRAKLKAVAPNGILPSDFS
jgi:hypothetical protein